MKQVTYGPIITEIGEVIMPEQATVEELVCAGNYDAYANPEINNHFFQITCHGRRRLFLAEFKIHKDIDSVRKQVAAIGNRKLALMEDLLAVGAHPDYRELQRQFLIICLGADYWVRQFRRIPFLFAREGKRGIDLMFFSIKWHENTRFLLVECPFPSR